MMRQVVTAGLALAAVQVAAQTVVPPSADPGAVQQRQIEEERKRREAEQDRLKQTEPLNREALQPPPAKPADATVRFLVKGILFTPSEILSAAELEEHAKDFRDRELSLADLQQLTQRINELYRAKHVVTAQAIIPPQEVSQGIVHVRLVEGRVGQTSIQGNASTRTGFIEHRVHLTAKELVDLDRLERNLVRFNRTNDVQLRAELKPGVAFGTTDFRIEASEPSRHDLRLMLDDLGSPTTGRMRLTGAYLNRSLFGFRDALSLSDSEADGQSSRAISYGFPINRWGGRFDLANNQDKTAIKHGPLKPLNITGESKAWTLSLRQPAYLSQRQEWDILAGHQKRDSTNWIDSELLMRTETRMSNVGLEWQSFSAKNYWLASYTHSFGHATVVHPVTLAIGRGALRYSHDFGRGLAFNGSLTWQSTSQTSLPSSELFFIGGDGSVRGYVLGACSGDTGHLLNLELHHPLGTWFPGDHKLATTGVVFLDHGSVTPFRPPNSTLSKNERLTGIGWGVNATFGKSLSGRLIFGHGLTKVSDDRRDQAVHFQLVASLF